jgi:hypothetical protein
MTVSIRTHRYLTYALADIEAANELVGDLNAAATVLPAIGTDDQVIGVSHTGGSLEYKSIAAGSGVTVTKTTGVITVGLAATPYTPTVQSPVVPVAVTYSSGSAPTITGDAITIADSTTPTVVELLAYCTALKANIASLQSVLHANGLNT